MLPLAFVHRRHELAVSLAFATERRLFGEVYALLQPDYFWDMKPGSGVFVRPVVPTADLSNRHSKPGDIDLLIIPYENDEIVLDRVLALEVKVIRARHARQGQSPNEFGITQATSLKTMGFPYVGLLHLIVSDVSPEEEWEEVRRVRVIDKQGRAERVDPVRMDMMPFRLIRRAIGRLERMRTWPELGLAATYMVAGAFDREQRDGISWEPAASRALWNENYSEALMSEVAAYFDQNAPSFLDNPRFDPA